MGLCELRGLDELSGFCDVGYGVGGERGWGCERGVIFGGESRRLFPRAAHQPSLVALIPGCLFCSPPFPREYEVVIDGVMIRAVDQLGQLSPSTLASVDHVFVFCFYVHARILAPA